MRRALSTLLIGAGLLLLADAGATLLWQEPVSALRAGFAQERLAGALARLERSARAQLRAGRRESELARALRTRTRDGAAVGRLQIPRIGVDTVVVAGTSAADLREGPGVYEESVLPGAGGTTAIAGHRTTYGAPFRHLDALRPGDEIALRMPYGTFTYRVTGSRVVDPGDVAAVAAASRGVARLVLTACTPLFSAARRLVVDAGLSNVRPTALIAGPMAADARSEPWRSTHADGRLVDASLTVGRASA
jgi:sortase A